MRSTAPLQALKVKPRRIIGSPFVAPRVSYQASERRTRTTTRQNDFNHLVHHGIPSFAKGNSKRSMIGGPEKNQYFVHFDDRIKFWNIAPGDRVIIADAPEEWRGKKGTVAWVDRTQNRLGLLEPEFRQEKTMAAYMRGDKVVQKVSLPFEYSTVRLLSPDSEDHYYEDLQEDAHACAPLPNDKRRLAISWRRTGVLRSMLTGKQEGEREAIPWPPRPKWNPTISDPTEIKKFLEAYTQRKRRQAPTAKMIAQAQATKEETRERRATMTEQEVQEDIRKENETREAKKEERRRQLEAKYLEGIGQDRAIRNRGYAYLYTPAKIAWERTFTSDPYDPLYLRLSANPEIRTRFPELFWRDDPSSSLRPSEGFTDSLLRPSYVPDLAVQDWEYVPGRHTERFRTRQYEARLAERLAAKVDAEAQEIYQGAEAAGEAMDETTKAEIHRMLSILNTFRSRLNRRSSLSIGDRRVTRKAIEEARHRIKTLKSKYEYQQVNAALQLLPELERFNTERMREQMSQAPRLPGGGQTLVAAVEALEDTPAHTPTSP